MAGIVGPDGERYIWVMDPMTRKLKVPLSVIEPTQATATAGTVPSLCMLFLDGRCKHPACRQVHISLPVLQKLRRDAQHAPTCCAHHGDQRDNSILVSNFSHVSIVANPLSNSPIPTPAGGNSPTPSAAAPPPPPPSYPAGGAATTTDSPELNGIMYPPLPSAANEKVSAPSGGGSTGASSYAAALLGGGATTSPQASAQASPPSYQQSASRGGRSPTPPPPQGAAASTVLFTIPSSKIAMTVGLQRYLAQSGYLGRSSTGTPVQSGTPTSPPGPAPYNNSSKKEGNSPPTNLPPPARGGGVDGTRISSDNKENATLNIPLKMICRLHLSHKCRYLEDCNNVHICREMESKLPAVSSAHPALGPQHCSDVLQSLRPKVNTATVGNTVYSVSVVSSGSISDTDMHQIVQNYKLSNPHVQLRIVDVRAGAAATTAASGSAHNTSKDSNDDHFLVSSSNEPSTLLPPASSISPSAFSSSGRGVLFGSSTAPISPPGPHQSNLQGDHSAAVTSQFAGPGTSPLLQDQGMPHSIIGGLGGGLGGLPPPMDALPAHLPPPPSGSPSTTTTPLPSSTSAAVSSLPSYSAGTTTSGGLTTYPPPPNRGRGVGTAGAGSRSQQRGNHHHLLSGETQVPGGGFVDESPGNGSGGGANVGIPTWAYGNTS